MQASPFSDTSDTHGGPLRACNTSEGQRFADTEDRRTTPFGDPAQVRRSCTTSGMPLASDGHRFADNPDNQMSVQRARSAPLRYSGQVSSAVMQAPPEYMEPVGPPSIGVIRHALASSIITGSKVNLVLCFATMIVSSGFSLVGIIAMTSDQAKQIIAIQSVAFLLAQSFGLSRVWRDWSICKDTDIARPSPAYFVMMVLFFIVAVALSGCSLIVSVEWHSFYILTLLWVTVSALLSSKAVRDLDFATNAIQMPAEEQSDGMLDMTQVCANSRPYQVLVWTSAAFAVGVTLISMWSWDEAGMEVVMKGFFTMCVFFGQGSGFHLGKLLTDRADPKKSQELQEHMPFQVTVVLSTVVAYVIPLLVVCMVELEIAKRFFLLSGLGFMMTTSFFVVKHTKDNNEFMKLMAPLVHSRISNLSDAVPREDLPTVQGFGENAFGDEEPLTKAPQGDEWTNVPEQGQRAVASTTGASSPFGGSERVPLASSERVGAAPVPPAAPPPLLPPGKQSPSVQPAPGTSTPPAPSTPEAGKTQDGPDEGEATRIMEQLERLRKRTRDNEGSLQSLRDQAKPDSDGQQDFAGRLQPT